MKSIWLPSTPPAALISLTASFAPLAAGRSSADSSPVRANPPPILIASPVPPLAAVLGAAADPEDVVAAGVPLHAAARPRTVASANPRAMVLRMLFSSGRSRTAPRVNARNVPQRVPSEQAGSVTRRCPCSWPGRRGDAGPRPVDCDDDRI